MITPVLFGCRGTVLGDDERAFFQRSQPLGLIIFLRNIQDRDQLTRLVEDFLHCLQHPFGAVFIDQEGGRVQRLKPPIWRQWPSPTDYRRSLRQRYKTRRSISRSCGTNYCPRIN